MKLSLVAHPSGEKHSWRKMFQTFKYSLLFLQISHNTFNCHAGLPIQLLNLWWRHRGLSVACSVIDFWFKLYPPQWGLKWGSFFNLVVLTHTLWNHLSWCCLSFADCICRAGPSELLLRLFLSFTLLQTSACLMFLTIYLTFYGSEVVLESYWLTPRDCLWELVKLTRKKVLSKVMVE